jgi:GDP-L-fucose synthase
VRLYIAGINGMVGSAIAVEARSQGSQVLGKASKELDFTDRAEVFAELQSTKPDALVIAAAKVGGIAANYSRPVDFLSLNLQIQTNLLDAAHAADISKVLFLGSSCIYPKLAPQPILESALLTGELEPTNEPYAIAKIAGLKLVQGYRNQHGRHWVSAMPTNLFGPRDNFDLESAHVLPALIHRFHNAKAQSASNVAIWGDGSPLREFLYVEDLARACMLLINKYDEPVPINIGSGQEISILDLATLVAKVIGFTGEIKLDKSRPNGTPRKLLDSTHINQLGWSPQVNLETGIASTYDWFLAHHQNGVPK